MSYPIRKVEIPYEAYRVLSVAGYHVMMPVTGTVTVPGLDPDPRWGILLYQFHATGPEGILFVPQPPEPKDKKGASDGPATSAGA